MRNDELQQGEAVLWEAVDQALFGTDLSRAERARVFCQEMDRRCEERGGRREKSLGGRLKELRREQEFTPTEAAEKIGIPARDWRSWEANQAIPSGGELRLAAGVVGEAADLWRLRRRAPRFHLERALGPRSRARVARTASGREVSAEEYDRLEIRNLDRVVRSALELALGIEDEGRLARALREARELSEGEQQRWLEQVLLRVELD